MTRTSKRHSKLTAAALVISDLIDTLADGNQRKFARMVECAQPVLSRIVNGKQQPGRDLMDRIAKLEGVDKELLFASLQASTNDVESCLIPIAPCLLDSCPRRGELLTANFLSVSEKVFRQTLYAVPARSCEPACNDPSERLQPDDLVVIESAIVQARTSLAMLDQRLCVVQVNKKSGTSLTLRRMRVQLDRRLQDYRIFTWDDAESEEDPFRNHTGRMQRAIQLNSPEKTLRAHISAKPTHQSIELSAIKGIAIQVIRNL